MAERGSSPPARGALTGASHQLSLDSPILLCLVAVQGIDAGEFSRGLMTHAAEAVRHGIRSAVDVLARAAEGVQKAQLKGSATVCIYVDPTVLLTRYLRVSNRHKRI